MNIILKIAKNERRHLFFSPIAWFVILVFLVQCAVLYTNPVFDAANWQDIMLKNNPSFKGFNRSLTSQIFVKMGLFSNVINNLYLFIPVLTMGLISRDVNSGAYKLLYSSPVSLRQIVLGKYLGIMMYNLLLVAILCIFMIIGMFNIMYVDYGMLLSAALGFYLLICAYSAIGLFMSSLTSYQVVSGLSTFAIIFILSRIGGLWQRYDLVRDLTYFLSLQNRIWKMLGGLIVSRDVFYFIIIACMFVGFTIFRLKAGREARPWYVRASRYIALMTAALLIGYTTSRPMLTAYFDTTANHRNTLPEPMQKIMKDFGDSTLEVTLYTNLLDETLSRGLPESRNVDYMDVMWEPYLRFKPDMKFKYVYYYDKNLEGADSNFRKQFSPGTSLKKMAEDAVEVIDADLSMFKTPEEMHKFIDLKPEGYRLVIQVKYKGRTDFLRTFNDPFFWPDLYNVSAAFMRLQQPSQIPKVYAVTGELERNIYKTGDREYALHTAYKWSRGALVNTGYDVDTLNLATQDIPADATTLLLADPKMELSPVARDKLSAYINAGGNILVTGMPGKQYVLNPVLQQLGVQLMNGQLVESTYDETPDKVVAYATENAGGLDKELSGLKKGLEINGDTMKILMPGTTALRYNNDSAFDIKPLLMTVPGRTWLKGGSLVIDSTLPPFNPGEGDIREHSFTTGVQLTRRARQKDQRLIVCGNADFISNMRMGTNISIVTPIYSWLTYNKFPIYMPRPDPKDVLLRIGEAGAAAQKIVYVWILPGLVLLAAAILLIRRKRK
ncbi:MAG: Gldg family protein [Chitinophagaceae bacterium]|nr:Gldg family protein [Chitinophagaceae bacterium]